MQDLGQAALLFYYRALFWEAVLRSAQFGYSSFPLSYPMSHWKGNFKTSATDTGSFTYFLFYLYPIK